LYIKLKRVICIEDIFNDVKTSELARNLVTLKNIIRKFDNYHQNEYLTKLNDLIRKYYNFLTANRSEDIVSGILEFRKSLIPFLEEIKCVAPTYTNLATILNVLHNEPNQDNISLAISETINEIEDFIRNSSLSEEEKKVSFNELKKILNKWQNIIESGNLELEENPDFFNLPAHPFSNISLEIERRIMKDLFGLKTNIVFYLSSLENYNEFASGVFQK